MNKDIISDMTPEDSRGMHIAGGISYAGGSRFIESVYRTDGAGRTGTGFDPVYVKTQHHQFKPPTFIDVLGSTQERKDNPGQRMKRAG